MPTVDRKSLQDKAVDELVGEVKKRATDIGTQAGRKIVHSDLSRYTRQLLIATEEPFEAYVEAFLTSKDMPFANQDFNDELRSLIRGKAFDEVKEKLTGAFQAAVTQGNVVAGTAYQFFRKMFEEMAQEETRAARLMEALSDDNSNVSLPGYAMSTPLVNGRVFRIPIDCTKLYDPDKKNHPEFFFLKANGQLGRPAYDLRMKRLDMDEREAVGDVIQKDIDTAVAELRAIDPPEFALAYNEFKTEENIDALARRMAIIHVVYKLDAEFPELAKQYKDVLEAGDVSGPPEYEKNWAQSLLLEALDRAL